jgi:hypothetical protein
MRYCITKYISLRSVFVLFGRRNKCNWTPTVQRFLTHVCLSLGNTGIQSVKVDVCNSSVKIRCDIYTPLCCLCLLQFDSILQNFYFRRESDSRFLWAGPGFNHSSFQIGLIYSPFLSILVFFKQKTVRHRGINK